MVSIVILQVREHKQFRPPSEMGITDEKPTEWIALANSYNAKCDHIERPT